MGGRPTLLRSLLWSLFALSVVALPDDLHRRAAHYPRASVSPSSQSPSVSSPSASPSSSSASVPQSSSASRSVSSIPSSSPSSSAPRSSSSTTTTSSSSTPVITTTTTSSSASSASSSPSSSVSTRATSTTKPIANLVPTSTPTNTPTTTLDGPANIATNSDSDPAPTNSVGAKVNAASKGFWGNKGAVGGTFTVVALAVVGILVALGLVLRRRAASHSSARDTFFDTKNPPPADHAERLSSGPSMVSLGNEPLDAHATAAPNYGAADQYLVDTNDYNVSYPPGASYDHSTNFAPAADHYYAADQQQYYTPAADPQQQHYVAEQDPYYAQGNAYDNYNQYYAAAPAGGDTGNGNGGYNVSPTTARPSLSPHPYSHPSHAPSALRDFAGRDSAYQQSIDSFYGAAGSAV